jgi:hypothetical protein
LVGLTAKNAAGMKAYVGKTAYSISCIRELIRRERGRFDIEIDDGLEHIKDLDTQYM